MSFRPRVLIADDHRLVAELCQRLLEGEFEVVDVVTNGTDLVSTALEMTPDVILVDLAMPVMNGLEAARRIKAALHEVKVIYLTMNSDPHIAMHAMDEGASGFLLKTCAASELVLAIRSVLKGRSWISPILKDKIEHLRWERANPAPEADRLTSRQREVLQLLAEGQHMQEAALTLGITARTIAFHKYRMMQTLGVTSNADLVRYALRNRVVAA